LFSNTNDNQDYLRDALLWLVFILVVMILVAIKPNAEIKTAAMYLPKITDLKATDKNSVKIIQEINVDNSTNQRTVGFITITLPNKADNIPALQLTAINKATEIVANAGAKKLLVEYMVVTPWFDTGKTVFRMQAVALS
jgi:hypothetical protein